MSAGYRPSIFILLVMLSGCSGNHPDAKACSISKPFFTFCTHHSHKLEGWKGPCFANQEDAERDAVQHAKRLHDGNDHWTGVVKLRAAGTSSYNY